MPQEWETGLVINTKKEQKANVKITEELFYCLQTIYKYNKNRLNGHVEEEMVEEQCGFRKGRSCTNATFTVQQIIKERKEHHLLLFLLFIDYEKA